MRLIFVILICFSGPVLSKYYEKTRFDRSVYGYSESPTVNGLAIRKRWTFTDDQTNYRAYRDRTENSCYLEKLGENVVAEEYPDIKFQPNRMTRTFYVSEDVLTKLEAWRLAGGRIVDFCQGRKIILLQTTVRVPEKAIDPFFNILPYDENDIASKRVADVLLTPLINRAKRQIQLEKREEINKSFNRLRSTRQTQHPRGKFRGQTQSQYLNIGNDDKKEGKAEAEATQQSSRSVVSGSRGMGQAQSMSFGSIGCEDCAKYTGEGPPDRYIQYPSTGPGTTYSRTSLPKHDGTSYPQDLAPGTLIKDGRPYTGGVTYPGGVPGTAGGVTYPGGVPGTAGGVIYPGRVPGTAGGVVYPGGVPGTAPGGGGVLHPGGAPGGKVLPPGHIPSTTGGGGAVYPGGIPGGIPGTTTGGGVVYPGGTPGTQTTGSGGIYPGGVPGTPTTGGGGTYPGGTPGTSITGGGIYPGGIPGTTTAGGGTYTGSGGTYTGGDGTYPGGVPGTGGGGTYPGGLPGIPTTGGGGTYHSGVPGTATARGGVTYPGRGPGTTTDGGVTYPGGVPGTRIDGGTVYPGGIPGTSTSGGGVTYPGGVPGSRIDGGTVYPGGVPGTTTGGGTTYPAGVPSTTTGGGVVYPGGVPGTTTGDGVVYPGGVPGTTTGGGVIYPGGVPGTTTGGGVIYPGGVPGTTTGGGVIYPGGVPGSRVSYPGGIPGTTTSGGVTYPGGIPGTTITGDARVYVGTMPSIRTGGGEVPYPGGIPGGGVIYPGSVPDITTSGGVVYPGGAPGTTTGTGVNYPGGIPGTTTGGVVYPAGIPGTTGGGVVYPGGIPGTTGGGVVYPGGIPGTTTGGGVVYPSGMPGITSNGNVLYPGGTASGSKDTIHGQIGQTNGQIPGGTPTGPGAANLYRETSTGTSSHTDSQGTVPGYPQQGQYPGYPQQGQYPGYTQPGQYPGYPQGQYPGTVTWQTGEKPVDQYTIDGQNIRQQYPGSQYPSKPGPATGETSQYFQQPGAVPSAEDDNSDSQASSIVKQTDAGTQASASAQGKYGQGTSQSQVTGTYSGSGSFSAQAGSTDNNKSAQTEISGGKEGATSNAQGTGGYGKSQAQVQLDSESGATSTGAQSSGWNHGTNSQVQASSKGGMADAQANGEGSTSSQAQIGFQPYMKTDEKVERHSRPFRGGGTASAQSGTHRGQSQSQLEGSFQYGITYTGAAQAGSGSGAAASRKPFSFNLTDTELFKPFKPSYIPHITKNSSDATNASSEVDYEYDQDKFQQGLQASSSSQKAVFVKQSTNENSKNVDIKQTQLDDTAYDYEEEYDGDEDDGGEQNNNNHQSQAVHLATGNQYDIHIKQDANTAQVGDTFHPGQSVSGYTIPPGFRGRVTSVSGSETVAHGDGKSQSQSVSLVPIEPNTSHGNKSPVSETRSLKTNRGRLIEDHVPSNEKQKDHFSQAPSRQSTMENSKPTASMPMKPSYYTVTNSVAGKMDDSKSSPRKYEHRYYTKSSTCGYFTFSCNVVYGSNGRTKICKPKMPTYPDGTPMKC